jgi:hypothetical protein
MEAAAVGERERESASRISRKLLVTREKVQHLRASLNVHRLTRAKLNTCGLGVPLSISERKLV